MKSTQTPAQLQKLTTNDALSYLREVKNRFQDRKEVYDTFLEIMKEFKAQRIDTTGVIIRVKQLFKGHRELILGFNTFLPRGYEIELARCSDDEEDEEEEPPAHAEAPQSKQPVEFDQAINYVNKIKSRFASDERVYKAFLEILNMYRKGQKTIGEVYDEVAVLFHKHKDLLDEFTYFLPDSNNQLPMNMRQHQQQGPGSRAHPGMQPRGGFQGPGAAMPAMRGSHAQGNGRMMGGSSPIDHSRLMHKRKAARKAEEGFRRLEDEDAYGAGSRGRPLNKEMQFLEKVKNRLRNREAYGDFMKCLNLFSQDIISRTELVHLVADIFGRMPDIMGQFHQFMNGCEQLDTTDLGSVGAAYGKPLPLTNKEQLKAKLQKDKFTSKPLSELVSSESERITPSYVKMPPGYPRLAQAGRTALGDEVLNDQYVNVITGSEDYSFKLMRKNQYEEALFRCEDDRYEFDIVMEQNASCVRVLKPVAEQLASMSPEDKAMFRIEDVLGLNQVHLGHIQRLYGEQGPILIELLNKNPAVAVPVVLHRLEGKDVEWRRVKEEMTRIWRKIYEQNYPRSLDHRSFYFKQQEKKNMMTKSMVAEIKEAADRRKADEQQLRILSMAHRYVLPAVPQPNGCADLGFHYADKAVFEDVYVVLHAAIRHGLSPGARNQVLQLYLSKLEPLLGVTERTTELERLRAEAAAGKDMEQDMAENKSDSSDNENGHDDEDGRKTPTPLPDGTPEPGADDTHKDEVKDEHDPHGDARRGLSSEAQDREARLATGCKPLMPLLSRAEPSKPLEPTATSGAAAGTQAAEAGAQGPASDAAVQQPAAGGAASGQGTGSAPAPGQQGPQQQPHYVPCHGTRLLFGNESIYLFFRFHRYVYERMSLARKLCLDIATKKATAATRAPLPLGQPLPVPTSAAVAEAADAASKANALDPAQQAAIKDEADRIHAAFMTTVVQMLGTRYNADQGIFEDAIWNQLGTNSYELFTLDKLLNKLAKHMQSMVTEDVTSKLWDMYAYEQSRSQPIAACMYHVNSHTVLEDTCYRIEYSDADNVLRFQMNDPEKSDPHAGVEGCPTAYINGFVSAGPTPAALLPVAAVSPTPLFLRRCLPGDKDPSEEALLSALQLVLIQNGLECKIQCATDKVSYVLDTEDVLARKKRCMSSQATEAREAARRERFAKWLAAANRQAVEEEMHDEEQAAAVLTGAVAAQLDVVQHALVKMLKPSTAVFVESEQWQAIGSIVWKFFAHQRRFVPFMVCCMIILLDWELQWYAPHTPHLPAPLPPPTYHVPSAQTIATALWVSWSAIGICRHHHTGMLNVRGATDRCRTHQNINVITLM